MCEYAAEGVAGPLEHWLRDTEDRSSKVVKEVREKGLEASLKTKQYVRPTIPDQESIAVLRGVAR